LKPDTGNYPSLCFSYESVVSSSPETRWLNFQSETVCLTSNYLTLIKYWRAQKWD